MAKQWAVVIVAACVAVTAVAVASAAGQSNRATVAITGVPPNPAPV